MLERCKRGECLKFENLKLFENLEILFLKSHFLLEANMGVL